MSRYFSGVTSVAHAQLAKKKWWQTLYRDGQDIFTLEDVNPNLRKYWGQLAGTSSSTTTSTSSSSSSPPRRCLVPLCGRDISLTWLASQPGWGAVGVDFADDALRLFGAETGGLAPLTNDDRAPFQAFQSLRYPRLLLAHGDFMTLGANEYGGPFEAAWDRGGFTSMNSPGERSKYAARLGEVLHPGGKVLMEMLDTNIEMEGACQYKDAAQALSAAGFAVEELSIKDVKGEYPDFNPPGLSYLREVVLIAERK